MKRSRKQRQWWRAVRFAKHLRRFVDEHRFPHFHLTDAIIHAEAKRQSHGERALSEEEKVLIEPLRDAQRWKEVTIDGLVEEMADWWSAGAGWFYPIHAEILRIRNDWIMKKALLEIYARCHTDFLCFLRARGGCERFIERRV